MESKITQEIDTYDSIYHFKIGILFSFILVFLFFLLKNISNNDPIPFTATFNYVEGINNNSEVQLAGIKIGDVNKIKISPDGIWTILLFLFEQKNLDRMHLWQITITYLQTN